MFGKSALSGEKIGPIEKLRRKIKERGDDPTAPWHIRDYSRDELNEAQQKDLNNAMEREKRIQDQSK